MVQNNNYVTLLLHTIVFVIMSEMWKINKNERMCPLDMDDPASG